MAASSGGLLGFLGGPPAAGAPFLELYFRADAAAAWSVVMLWPPGAPHPALLASIREARVDGWVGVDVGAVELPPVPPATPPAPVNGWVRGYPGPTMAAAGAGTATVMAFVDSGDGDGDGSGDGRRLVSWTVEGVRWAPAAGGVGGVDGGGGGGTDRVVALEDGLYLSVMADARGGVLVDFGSTTPPRAGQARQRVLAMLDPGAVISRVVHEVYPPAGGGPAACARRGM